MRKDITIEKLMLGGEKVNKSALTRQYGFCWRPGKDNVIDFVCETEDDIIYISSIKCKR